MGKLDIQFLGGIESENHCTSLGGSCQLYTYSVRGEIAKVLLDIGGFVGMDPAKAPNHLDHINITEIKAIIITHVHNDHMGRLAEIVKAGYRGPIYMTQLSADLLVHILDDSLKIQRAQIEASKEYNKRLGRKLQEAHSMLNNKHKKSKLSDKAIQKYEELLDKYAITKNSDIAEVLETGQTTTTYDEHDVLQTLRQIKAVPHNQEFQLHEGLWSALLLDAGHVAGSAQVLMDFKWNRKNSDKFPFKLINTGDLGRPLTEGLLDKPYITHSRIDATIIEGTYGGRSHVNREPEMHEFIQAIKDAKDNFVLPAFSLQRFQEIMYAIWSAMQSGSLKLKKEEKIYCTSPLAYNISTILMRKDPEKYGFLADPIFYWIQNPDDAATVDALQGRKIIIAGGGMVQGGSSVRYVQQALQKPNAQIRLTGYQGAGTLGRELLDKFGTTQGIYIGDKISPIRATVKQLKSFSSHADEKELVQYMKKLDIRSSHKTIITHGGQQRYDLKSALQDTGIKTTYYVPDLFDTISIETVKNPKVNKRYK